MIGTKVDNWVVIAKDEDNSRNWVIQCLCGCGQTRSVRGNKIAPGVLRSCPSARRPKVGDQFGNWVVIDVPALGRKVKCLCKGCDKGTERDVDFSTLKNGTSTDCGCGRKATLRSLTEEQKQATLAKYQATCHQRYGVDNAAKAKVVKKKIKAVTLEKYGVENISYLQETKDKIVAAHKALGGTPCYLQSEAGKEKSKETSQENYGTDHPMQSEVVRNRAVQTNLERYGVENPMQSIKIRRKQVATVQEKYGVDNVSQLQRIKELKQQLRDERVKRTQCKSRPEIAIQQWLGSIGIRVEHYSSRATELDLYSPDHKIGIEHNGLWFHSELHRKWNYHIKKTEYYQEQGIRVIHIWGHWWKHRQAQTKNFLKSVFGVNPVVFARKTQLKVVPKKEAWAFIEANHIQGPNKRTKLALGLYQGDKLLCVATFSQHHRKSTPEIILDRFCCDSDVNVVGGLSKLVKRAVSHFQQPIYSWADRCISDGQGYLKAGWELVSTTEPSYFYWNQKTKQVVSKQSRKKSIVSTPSGMTEHEHALTEGWLRIYDCGKYKYKFSP